MIQTVGWMTQKSSVKQPQQLFCWKCTVWGSIVVLKDHTSWQTMCSGCVSNTLGGWGGGGRGSWFNNDKEVEVALPECICKSLVSAVADVLNLCQERCRCFTVF